MTIPSLGGPVPDSNQFEVTIVSPLEIKVAHRAEGHLYSYAVAGADGRRALAPPVITPGNHAHDPLAYQHAALLRAHAVAAGAQMIDTEHSVVSMFTRQEHREE